MAVKAKRTISPARTLSRLQRRVKKTELKQAQRRAEIKKLQARIKTTK